VLTVVEHAGKSVRGRRAESAAAVNDLAGVRPPRSRAAMSANREYRKMCMNGL